MPGPKSSPNGVVRDKAKPKRSHARRAAVTRLKARQEGYIESNPQNGQEFHLAGSQNRNK